MHEQPSLHGEAEFWGLAWEALDFIERTVQPGMATLETGAGASTIVFAARGAEHEAVTPSADEAERITRRVRAARDLDREAHASGSGPRPTSSATGSRARSTSSWSTARTPSRTRRSTGGTSQPHVKIGGLMLLDDAYMPPVAAVVDHCATRRPGGSSTPVSFRTAVVRKLADEMIDGEWKGERPG